jgi:hypothetical protein
MPAETITKQVNQLKVGDIIVSPGGEWHRVVPIDHHGLAGAWLTIHTSTGLALHKSQIEARLHTYEVLRDSVAEGAQ